MQRLAAERRLSICSHHRFWHSMDKLGDKRYPEHLWASGRRHGKFGENAKVPNEK